MKVNVFLVKGKIRSVVTFQTLWAMSWGDHGQPCVDRREHESHPGIKTEKILMKDMKIGLGGG